ncbi:uncharacterized protein K489DRAFT_343762, partial [Dissoconium aciculare CBS 342.82]|uniref:Uncharacterized protein n=1 Tax=Dissoconium aciculare CBS 342.82 TaxID=1314786 RepID=A0A6J3LWS7_9PEZI
MAEQPPNAPAVMLPNEPLAPPKPESIENPASPSSFLGLNHASLSPRSDPKSVSIAPLADTISPLMLGRQKSVEEIALWSGRP